MKKFLTIVGNRPQLIKFDKKLKNQIMVYTGQHYDKTLKDIFFKGMKLPKPDYDLNKTKLGEITDGIMKIIDKEAPSYVIVYGDTRSTLAGAMAALYKNIPLIHIEAGCRSYNEAMPEERIRRIVDDIAIIHFAPSQSAKETLERDINNITVYNVGATQIDSMFEYAFPTKKPKDAYEYVVMTLHREQNLNKEALSAIFSALEASKEEIRFYIHPNTERLLKRLKISVPKNVLLKPPIPYKEMINELAFAKKVLTDSGGLQVEAMVLRRPCITLRPDTEWPESVEHKWNTLVDTDEDSIKHALGEPVKFGNNDARAVYGGGDAKKKIRMILENL